MEVLLKKTGWCLITAFFVLIAWATSIDNPVEVGTIPISAYPDGTVIWLQNESLDSLQDLTLVLNGIYSISNIDLGPQAELRIPLASFEDRNQSSFPATEIPTLLEVYSNGADSAYTGGYKKIEFE